MSTTKGKWAALRRDAGGPWLAYFPPYLLLTPVWFITSVLLLLERGTKSELAAALVANSVALGLCAAELGVLRHIRLQMRPSTSVPVALVLISGAILGGTKTVVTSAIFWFFYPGTSFLHDLSQRAPATIIIGMWLLPTLSIIFATLEKFQREKQALLTTLATSWAEKDHSWTEHSEKYSQRLSAIITESRVHLLSVENNPAAAARVLNELAQQGVRDLSHDIWKDHNVRFTNFSLKDLVKTALQQHRYHPVGIVITYVLFTAPAQFFYATSSEALARLSFQAFLIAVICEIAQRIRTTSLRSGTVIYVGIVVLTPLLIDLSSTALFGKLGSVDRVIVYIVLVAMFSTTTLIFAIFSVVMTSHKQIQSELVGLLGKEELEKIHLGSHQLADRELAQYLHGYVQSKILASALRISSSSGVDAVHALASERITVEKLFQEIELHGKYVPRSFAQEQRVLTSEWQSFAQIYWNYDVAWAHSLETTQLRALVEICREAITNAVRHGLATIITVDISPTTVVVTDNGTGPRNGAPGLGSSLFTSIAAPRTWSLVVGDPLGSILTVEWDFADSSSPQRRPSEETRS